MGEPVKIFLVSAYAPVGAASRKERDEYAGHLQLCLNACGKDEILVLGTDSNASAGVRSISTG